MGEQMPSIGRMVHYVNLGDKDGKYPPEIQAAIITGIYKPDPTKRHLATPAERPGNNIPADHNLITANAVGDTAGSYLVDLCVKYRTGEFNMACVPFSPGKHERGHWTYPPRA